MLTCKFCAFGLHTNHYREVECRRHAPIVRRVEFTQDLRGHIPEWPLMKEDDWCGEFRRERKASQGRQECKP